MPSAPRVASVLVLGAAALTVGAVSVAGVADAASTATVRIKDIDFSPHTLIVKKGTTVTWKFLDGDTDTPHNVTSRGTTRFRSSTTKQSGTYSVRFAKAGTYRYVCTIHPNMKAKVVVR
jgi:plastocyanin